MVYESPRRAYEVEVTDPAGGTVALLTLEEKDLEEVEASP
jgi:hypothetical protein